MPKLDFFAGRIRAVLLAAVVLAAGCGRPPAESSGVLAESGPPPSASSTSSGIAAGTGDLVLSAAVAQILKADRRTGSIVERCSCVAGRRMAEVHFVSPELARQPMAQAFRQIAEHYPQIRWDSGGERVRVVDRSAIAGLLKVRVRHFLVVEDRPPQAALPALWQTPEVQSYMRKHGIRFARWRAPAARAARTSPRVIQGNNATVAEILDRMVEGYRPVYSAWAYRECRSHAGTMIEIALY
ncbi:MAG TPA: hypothetical protein VFP59_19835 [Candidatus Angelobacter sp.]|nr:hypothetical protein [Candidatus Angelobacter sp.]